jgi:tRNA A-37 threonylcarbamoyl transferase component Bud32
MATADERFVSHRIGDLEIAALRELPPAIAAQAIALHRANAEKGRDACLKWGPGSSVSHVRIRSAGGEHDLAVKWNPWRGLRGALSDALHGSRAARARRGAERIAAAGLRQPQVLAVAERRAGGLVRESFLLTRFARGAEPLPVVMAHLRDERESRRALLRRLGEAIGALHASGLDHRDLKHSNLLVDAQGEVAFLDLEALGELSPFAWRRRARALGELEAFARDLYPWLPARERLCFGAGYLRAQPELRARRRALLSAARRAADRRSARMAKRPRPAERHFPLAPRDTHPCTVADAVEGPAAVGKGGIDMRS